jgi:hypothetical protein
MNAVLGPAKGYRHHTVSFNTPFVEEFNIETWQETNISRISASSDLILWKLLGQPTSWRALISTKRTRFLQRQSPRSRECQFLCRAAGGRAFAARFCRRPVLGSAGAGPFGLSIRRSLRGQAALCERLCLQWRNWGAARGTNREQNTPEQDEQGLESFGERKQWLGHAVKQFIDETSHGSQLSRGRDVTRLVLHMGQRIAHVQPNSETLPLPFGHNLLPLQPV